MSHAEENYYTNAEVARLVNVSKTTVKNWIDRTIEGSYKLDLTLRKNKYYISKTDNNYQLFFEYKSKGFKYKSNITRKSIAPSDEFISELSEDQLIELKKSLEDNNEIDLKFAYLDGGAFKWDEYYLSVKDNPEDTPVNDNNLLLGTYDTIKKQFEGKKINIIDLGSGNGLPLIEFIKQTHSDGILNSYTSVDISRQLCHISKANVDELNIGIKTNYHVCDIEQTSFQNFVYKLDKLYPNTINVFFLIGGTLGNFSHPGIVLKNIHQSMDKADLLYISNKYPDKTNAVDVKPQFAEKKLSFRLHAVHSLGIEADKNNITIEFNEDTNIREMFVKLESNYSLSLNINGNEEIIELEKGSKLKIWQHQLLDLHMIDSMVEKTFLRLNLYVLSSDNKFMLLSYKKI